MAGVGMRMMMNTSSILTAEMEEYGYRESL